MAKDFHDAEAMQLATAIRQATSVKVETVAEDGTVAGWVVLPHGSILAALAGRDKAMAEIDRKLAAGECQELKLNL